MKIIIIGAGFGGLSAAAYLAKAGHDVTVLEKNDHPGGRANAVFQDGFQFELGPSWYLMPDVFEEFFADFDHTPQDFYKLERLTPSYRVYGEHDEIFEACPRPAASMAFERREPGAGHKLARFLDITKKEYEFARRFILPLSGLSKSEFLKVAMRQLAKGPALVKPYHNRIAGVVDDELLQHVLEFMTLFLGGSPQNSPALYAMLAHVDFGLGVWYPKGGFRAVAKAVEAVAQEQGAKIAYSTPVKKLIVENGVVSGVQTEEETHYADAVVANADYHFVDSVLTPEKYRIYGSRQWQQKTLSPSVVLAMIGVRRQLSLAHHTLFFDADWEENISNLFEHPRASKRPLFYVNTPSKTDAGVAPKGCENLTMLIPVSNKLVLQQHEAEKMVQEALERVEERLGEPFQKDIVIKKVFTPEYFKKTFNAYNGNAFGLSHTLKQTGPLRPPIRSPKLANLYFVGHYTNPGTGVPLVLLSGKITGNYI